MARRRGRLCYILGLAAAVQAWPYAAMAGPPFVTDDPVPVPYQHWEINNALTGTLSRDGNSAGLPMVDANYGALPGLQLHLQSQITRAWTSSETHIGLGDLEIGAKCRLLDEDPQGWRPMIGLFPLLELPTGNAKQGLGAGGTRGFIPIWVEKSLGRWILDGGGGYWIDPEPGGRNAWFAGGLVLYQVTDPLQLGGELFQQTAQTKGAHSSPGFNLGGTYDFNSTYHLLFSAGRGLPGHGEANRFSMYLGVQLTF